MHEQSETIQLPSGHWINVYGRATRQAGQQLPGTPQYTDVESAVEAAKARSAVHGDMLRQKEQARKLRGDE